ncbi:hypothetical protein H0H87_006843, partial [Tephrocybe sp. NHM501043]
MAAVATCILGLLLNPSALKKAQDEIDRVVGTEQLPTFDDVDLLPYITAITKETEMERCCSDLAMLHDENIYPNPFDFNPDRFMKDGKLDPNAKDPMHAAFGFGRRICPGRYMAFSAVWIAVASIVATFDITKARDANGEIIEPSQDYISTIV